MEQNWNASISPDPSNFPSIDVPVLWTRLNSPLCPISVGPRSLGFEAISSVTTLSAIAIHALFSISPPDWTYLSDLWVHVEIIRAKE